MQINLKEEYFGSLSYKIFKFLFIDDQDVRFDKTFFGSLLLRLNNVFISTISVALAIFFILYESILPKDINGILLTVLPLIFLIVSFLFLDKTKIKISKFHIYYLIFLLVSAISAIVAAINIGGFYIFFGWIIFAQVLLLIFIGQAIGEKILSLVMILFFPMSIYAIYQYIIKTPTPSQWFSVGEAVSTRVTSFLGNPNVLGILACIIVLASLGQFLKRHNKLYILSFVASFVVVILTLSRTALLALCVALFVSALLYKPKAIFLSPLILLLLFIPQLKSRILFVFGGNYIYDSSLDGRIWAWINGLYIFKKHMLLGTGPGTYGGQLALSNISPVYLEGIQNGYTALYFTDNQILEIIVQTGLFGILAFAAFAISLGVKLIRKFKSKNDIIALTSLSVFVALFVSGLFANVLEFGAVTIPAGLIIGAGLSEN